ncbi:MAG: hypothetical protein KIY12_08235 [Thermoplasmata archaeon]|uniref:Translation elongation factor EFTu-like domain-containing protein n=1 Tax=Candidatus Sysuiplasma superficiale TaxID=2823368 RepID=A0A8J7YUE3_9ARCH|nr:hypothetical protein [Candidatus Sysuiplasma superficiale]MCL4346834.1 hypothetical protein [Candidatus Thermoplasmatota archaeon]
MRFANVVFVGDTTEVLSSIASRIAKKGTASDLLIFDKREGDMAVSITVPQTYPERVQPLLQSLYMSDAAVLFASSIDSTFGEEIVAISTFSLPGIVVAESGIADRVASLVKSRLAGWNVMTKDEDVDRRIWEFILNLNPERNPEGDFWRVDVDHSFEVKGAGTVVLGIVRYGTVRVHDKLISMPGGDEGLVRSIQIFDIDHQSAEAGSRVGLALRGLTPDQIPRGTVLTNNMHFQSSRSISMSFAKENYYREAIEPGRIVHLNIGLQCVQSRVIEFSGRLELEADQEIAFEDERAVVFSAKPPGQLRIAGHGRAGKFIV